MGNSVRRRVQPRVVADATAHVTFFWNDRAKAWDVRAENAGGLVVLKRAETASELDHSALFLLVEAIVAEMEQWMY